MNIQTITSSGGIEAWLVEEHAVPMLALRFAFDGGSVQNPAGQEGLANGARRSQNNCSATGHSRERRPLRSPT